MRRETGSTDDVVFFLGAGASVEAGIPDTRKFVTSFERDVIQSSDKEIQESYKWLKDGLSRNGRETDLELLLEALTRLQEDKLQKDVLSIFSPIPKDSQDRGETLASLLALLRGYIRERMIVPRDRTDYLDPLLAFVEKYELVDIFTVNYDACIELMCERNSVRYTDGFELYWDMNLFGKNCSVNLLKLHGSITWWYNAEREVQFKLPIKPPAGMRLELVDGQTIENLIMYPAEFKLDISRPITELIHLLRTKLENAKLLIVVGYTFRDPDLTRIMVEGASKNRNFRVLLVSPHASKTYVEKLAQTPLANRVGIIQRPFGEVLRAHRLFQLVGSLPEALHGINVAKEYERKGRQEEALASYLSAATQLSKLGFVFEARNMTEQHLPRKFLRPASERDEELIDFYTSGLFPLLDGLDFQSAAWWVDRLTEVIETAVDYSERYRKLLIDLAFLKRLNGVKPRGWIEKSILEEVPDPTTDDLSILRESSDSEGYEKDAIDILRVRHPRLPDEIEAWSFEWYRTYLRPIKDELVDRTDSKVALLRERGDLVSEFIAAVEEVEHLSEVLLKSKDSFISRTDMIVAKIRDAVKLLRRISSSSQNNLYPRNGTAGNS